MMELNEANSASDINNTTSSKKEQRIESLESVVTVTSLAGSVKGIETPSGVMDGAIIEPDKDNSSIEVTSMSGKRNHNGQNISVATTTTSSIGLRTMGVNNAKRGRREWLSFRGSRQTRVGGDFQVSSLPPVEAKSKEENTSSSGRGK